VLQGQAMFIQQLTLVCARLIRIYTYKSSKTKQIAVKINWSYWEMQPINIKPILLRVNDKTGVGNNFTWNFIWRRVYQIGLSFLNCTYYKLI